MFPNGVLGRYGDVVEHAESGSLILRRVMTRGSDEGNAVPGLRAGAQEPIRAPHNEIRSNAPPRLQKLYMYTYTVSDILNMI